MGNKVYGSREAPSWPKENSMITGPGIGRKLDNRHPVRGGRVVDE